MINQIMAIYNSVYCFQCGFCDGIRIAGGFGTAAAAAAAIIIIVAAVVAAIAARIQYNT